MNNEELAALVKSVYGEIPEQILQDMETVTQVRAGNVVKAMNSAFVIWSKEYYDREMERVWKILGSVPGAGHPGGDPAGVQQGRPEPDGP